MLYKVPDDRSIPENLHQQLQNEWLAYLLRKNIELAKQNFEMIKKMQQQMSDEQKSSTDSHHNSTTTER